MRPKSSHLVLILVLATGAASSLLPLGLIVVVFGAVCLIPAYAGAWLRRMLGAGRG